MLIPLTFLFSKTGSISEIFVNFILFFSYEQKWHTDKQYGVFIIIGNNTILDKNTSHN